jgi:hypothetical protein
MTRKHWDKLWADLDKRCQQSDFDWKAQKKWIEKKLNALLRAAKVK